jgi:hypothetical protein
MVDLIVLYLALGLIPAVIASKKGNSGANAFALAMLISPALAIIFVIAARPNTKKIDQDKVAGGHYKQCPSCAEIVKRDAVVCPFCQREIRAQPRTLIVDRS